MHSLIDAAVGDVQAAVRRGTVCSAGCTRTVADGSCETGSVVIAGAVPAATSPIGDPGSRYMGRPQSTTSWTAFRS